MAKKKEPDISSLLPTFSIEDVALATLHGDVRDVILTHFRAMQIPWGHLNEEEQQDKIDAFSALSGDLIRRVVRLIAASEFPVVHAIVGAFKVDKALEIKLNATQSVENVTRLAEHGKGSAVLVLADVADYLGERAPAKPDKDQPDLPLSGEKA